MGLSRLDNFLKSTGGTIIYVDPSSIDSTDSIENQGNSLSRPFKTIQRALIESARFSYQGGSKNDRFNKTTILLYPGDHVVDNRPGYIPYNEEANSFKIRSGDEVDDLVPFDLTSNFDLENPNNELYKLNSVYGGVIIPRGTSIVGMDLRKTKIRPKYVPNPENDDIERSCVFRVTGGCYLWQFTILDADPNGVCFKDYTKNIFVPNFSHHKLSCFEYADGVNDVVIDDPFISNFDAGRTDLDIYYEKVGIVYGTPSGRDISPDYPSTTIDIEPVIDEYRIVGSRGAEVGISSIRAGNGTVSNTEITVTLSSALTDINVNTPIQVSGVGASGYDGQYLVSEVNNSQEIVYQVQNAPVNPLPSIGLIAGATLSVSVDTVTSASPYIFNCSLRSVYGMCGLLADGSKATGFKSMVVAQFTGIGLQKDDNAFVKYNPTSGVYQDSTAIDSLHTDSLSRFKPEYENFHIKATNDAFLQLVSVFAIGYAQHFVAESGGDLSITNSNSNFGAKSLVSSGFREESFPRDDIGYITHVIPPKQIETEHTSVEFVAIDVGLTTSISAGAATTSRLYLYNESNQDIAPTTVIDGYRLGARENDNLYVEISQSGVTTQYSARITMPNTNLSAQKVFTVGRSVSGINSINSNTLTFTENHSFLPGESIRLHSENGILPDGLNSNQLYYAITTGSNSTIKIAQTINDALTDKPISINQNGGILTVLSKVSDKVAGDIGHPVQWDSNNQNWYVNVAIATTENTIYNTIKNLGTSRLGEATPRTYFIRKPDTRNLLDTIYRFRYVIPKDSSIQARPPLDAFVIQESNNVIGSGTTEISKYFDPTNSSTLSNSTDLRNPRFIADATWSSNIANIITETPHDLKIGSQVEIINIKSTNNTSGTDSLGFNGTFTVTGISSTKHFSYSLETNPGTFTNDTSIRSSSLPAFKKKTLFDTYQIYRTEEIQKYIPGSQDGVYHLILTNASNSPVVAPFTHLKFSQPIQNLYPQTNRDNPTSDPAGSASAALPDPIGQVVINDPKKSITRETVHKLFADFGVGIGVTNIRSNSAGTAHTIYTKLDHGLSGITSVSIVNGGSGYGSNAGVAGYAYNARLVGIGTSVTGANATAVVTFDTSGTITAVKIMDGGSAYGIGNTLAITGISTLPGSTRAVVQVTGVYNNINDCVQLDGVSPNSNDSYNTLYKITGITPGNTKQFEVQSSTTISTPSTTGIGSTNTSNANAKVVGKTLGISTITYSPTTGLATIGFTTSHGFRVGNKLRLSGATNSFFNGDFIVNKINSLTSLVTNVGFGTTVTSTGGTITVYRTGYGSNGGDITPQNENVSGRFNFEYAGITTVIGSQLATASDGPLTIPNATTLGFKLGDYIQINDEVLRIKSDVISNSVSVFRELFGTRRQTHDNNSVVRRINVHPIEFRRNSIIRASGHTFEYLGFGPGNYSTALPEKQDRILSPQEEFISQNTRANGGVSIFTAMNSDGDFYTGNKKVNSSTGQEEVFDAPVPSVTGEELNTGNVSLGFDLVTPLEVSITRSLRVEGGSDSNLVSEFDGPVIFNNKITSNSDKGIEANSIFVQGEANVSRKFTVGISTPTLAGNYGDVVTRTEPVVNQNLGWVYTTENEWKQWGWIRNIGEPLYGVGISTNSGPIGFSTLLNIVGVGMTITRQYDSRTGITTILLEGDPVNTIGIRSEGRFIGEVNAINFVGSDDGFGFNISVGLNTSSGITTATVTLDAPVDIIDFRVSGDGNLGYAAPSFGTTSIGTRIIYENSIGLSTNAHTNYAVGIGADDSLWWSVPQDNSYAFNWYGGTKNIAKLLSNGELSIFGNSTVTAGRFISTSTSSVLSPIGIATSTLCTNLNANYLQGFVSAATTTPNTIVRRDSSNNINGNVSHLIHNVSGAQRGEWYTDIPARQGYVSFNRAGDTCTGGARFVGLTTITQVSDIYKNQSTVGTALTCDFTSGPITRSTSTDITTININNVPTTDERAFNYTVVLNASTTVSNLQNIQFQINGTSLSTGGNSLRWLNNIPPTGTESGYYFFGFTIFRVGSVWEVLGVFATYAS